MGEARVMKVRLVRHPQLLLGRKEILSLSSRSVSSREKILSVSSRKEILSLSSRSVSSRKKFLPSRRPLSRRRPPKESESLFTRRLLRLVRVLSRERLISCAPASVKRSVQSPRKPTATLSKSRQTVGTSIATTRASRREHPFPTAPSLRKELNPEFIEQSKLILWAPTPLNCTESTTKIK